MRKCEEPGCGRIHVGRGLCRFHYNQQYYSKIGFRKRQPRRYIEKGKCEVEECERQAKTRKMCGMHYGRLMRTGSINFVKTPYRKTRKNPNSYFELRVSSQEELLRKEALVEAGINPDLV